MGYRFPLLIIFELSRLRKSPTFSAPSRYATILLVQCSEGHKPKGNENNYVVLRHSITCPVKHGSQTAGAYLPDGL